MKTLENLAFTLCLLPFTFACTGSMLDETAEDELDRDEITDEVDVSQVETQNLRSHARVPQTVQTGTTIYDVKQPRSEIRVGERVRISGANVKVTAVTEDRIFVQEVSAEGYCESAADVDRVAYRAIMVRSTDGASLSIGQRVSIDANVVVEKDGRRALNGRVSAVGPVGPEHHAVCDRDALGLDDDRLDDVLVETAGSTEQMLPPDELGTWSLATCLGDAGSDVLRVSGLLFEHTDWTASWNWVQGIATRENGSRTITPRKPDDVQSDYTNDVCL